MPRARKVKINMEMNARLLRGKSERGTHERRGAGRRGQSGERAVAEGGSHAVEMAGRFRIEADQRRAEFEDAEEIQGQKKKTKRSARERIRAIASGIPSRVDFPPRARRATTPPTPRTKARRPP